MQIDFVTIFPDLIRQWFSQGVIGRAEKKAYLASHITIHAKIAMIVMDVWMTDPLGEVLVW